MTQDKKTKIQVLFLALALTLVAVYYLFTFNFSKTWYDLKDSTQQVYRALVLQRHTQFIPLDAEFKKVNRLDYNVFSLNNYWDTQEHLWRVELRNLRTDSVHHSWNYYEKDLDLVSTHERTYSHAPTLGCILLEDRSLVVPVCYSNNLLCLDKTSTIKWAKHDNMVHHASNLDHQGNIWSCSAQYHYIDTMTGYIKVDEIMKTDVRTGEVLYKKSLLDILTDNDLEYLFHGSYYSSEDSDMQHVVCKNPIHLNDIEPALSEGTYWKKGDLFLSLRNKSIILQYRPSTHKVIRKIQGKFLNQHDVDIKSNHEISVFNNNRSTVGKYLTPSLISKKSMLDSISSVVTYNLETQTFHTELKTAFKDYGIFSPTEGLQHFLSNGDLFVEAQQQGKVYIFRPDVSQENGYQLLYANYMNQPTEDGFVEMPHWTKIYENIDF